MREDLKIQRAMQKLIALGVKTDVKPEEIKQSVREARIAKPEPLYSAEAVLLFLQKPARFMFKVCGREECGETFGTNYRSVNFCSDHCRAKELKKIGVLFDPSKRPEDRWGGEPPLLIPPEALRTLLLLATLQHESILAGTHQLGLDEEENRPMTEDLEYKDQPNGQVNDPGTTDQEKWPHQGIATFVMPEVAAFDF